MSRTATESDFAFPAVQVERRVPIAIGRPAVEREIAEHVARHPSSTTPSTHEAGLKSLYQAESFRRVLTSLLELDTTPQQDIETIMEAALGAINHLLQTVVPNALSRAELPTLPHDGRYIEFGGKRARLYINDCAQLGFHYTADLEGIRLSTGHSRIVMAPFAIGDQNTIESGLHLSYHFPRDPQVGRLDVLNIKHADELTAEPAAVNSLALHSCRLAKGVLALPRAQAATTRPR